MGKSGGNRINKKFFVSPPGISGLDQFVIIIKKCSQYAQNRCSCLAENDFSRI